MDGTGGKKPTSDSPNQKQTVSRKAFDYIQGQFKRDICLQNITYAEPLI